MTFLRRAKCAALRGFLRTVGRASDGVRIAFDEGFTSGAMLDYVYRNSPSGRGLLGPLIDQLYLSHPGWEAIRIRKAHIEQLLLEAVGIEVQLGRRPVILDVASGPARYLMDVLDNDAGARAVCCDRDEQALALGRAQAAARGMGDRIRFVVGDALSGESLASAEPQANIAVASGFYDWITDDSVVRLSLTLLGNLLPPGGCLVFTNQSGHVDLEMVQAVFLDFNRRPLRMVTRPPDLINCWAEAAGFVILQTARDEAGYYSVTLAQVPADQAPERRKNYP
jgi:SAM-dependent methyltransferase